MQGMLAASLACMPAAVDVCKTTGKLARALHVSFVAFEMDAHTFLHALKARARVHAWHTWICACGGLHLLSALLQLRDLGGNINAIVLGHLPDLQTADEGNLISVSASACRIRIQPHLLDALVKLQQWLLEIQGGHSGSPIPAPCVQIVSDNEELIGC